MVRIEKKGGRILLVLNDEEARQLQEIDGEFEFFQPKKGLLVLTEKEIDKNVLPAAVPESPKSAPMDEKIFRILSDRKQLSKRIVGEFEKTLSIPENKRLQELLKEGLVEMFKLSEKYKKPIYRLNEKKFFSRETTGVSQQASSKKGFVPSTFSVSKPDSTITASTKTFSSSTEFSSLTKNGFLVLKSDNEARRISYEHFNEFKKGELRGIKSFEGQFFVVKQRLLDGLQKKVLDFLRKQKAGDLQSISQQTSLEPEKVLLACEFLKEEGQVFEKTKHHYCLV